MKISAVLQVHDHEDLVFDTVESMHINGIDDILILVDGANWKNWGNFLRLPFPIINGLSHGSNRAPYRNVAYGLKKLFQINPFCDWYCYTEYDVLFTSPDFVDELKIAEENDIWLVGTNARKKENVNLSFIEKIFNLKFKEINYFLGCCLFFHKNFLIKLQEIDFFEKFLFHTNSFNKGFILNYDGYDISEHLYPTLAQTLGGKCMLLSTYDEYHKRWAVGNYQKYPIRFRPEMTEDFKNPSIIHPLKDYYGPIRTKYRRKRNLV